MDSTLRWFEQKVYEKWQQPNGHIMALLWTLNWRGIECAKNSTCM